MSADERHIRELEARCTLLERAFLIQEKRVWSQDMLKDHCDELSDEQRHLFRLHHLEHLPIHEIAARLEKTEVARCLAEYLLGSTRLLLSAGLPTKGEQGDLYQALFSAHGDAPRPMA